MYSANSALAELNKPEENKKRWTNHHHLLPSHLPLALTDSLDAGPVEVLPAC